MNIADINSDFPQWYQDVIQQAELAENGPVRGTMIIKPYGYAIWELMQQEMDRRIKATGVKNAYFPLFIPESFINREKAHVAGFSPELAVVTHAGGSKLAEPLVVRPTSETIFNDAFSRWIKSYRDLPLLINQWANIVRWEMRPRLFLRTTEFLWQEGHTAHATKDEADAKTKEMLRVYEDFATEVLAMPVVSGEKTAGERFAGAVQTFSIEAMMHDGKALQMGTSHNLGQNFAKVFNIQYLDKQNKLQYAWQTSWGVSTRMIGGLVMAHGDENGLVLPPAVAPIQAVIVPVKSDDKVMAAVEKLAAELTTAGIRNQVDDREGVTVGFKYHDWELKGVPVRIEIGPKDLAAKHGMVARRDNGLKESVKLTGLVKRVEAILADVQAAILVERQAELRRRTVAVDDYGQLKSVVATGFADGAWCGSAADEELIKEEAKATIRVIPYDQPKRVGPCAVCGQPGKLQVIYGRAY